MNARVVCATHLDLQQAVAEGRFREDLYYRLNVMQISIPLLRERPADITWLAERFATDFLGEGRPTSAISLSETTRQALLAQPWPGNVRELKNTIERACILHGEGGLTPQHLGLAASSTQGSLKTTRDAAEHARILAALAANRGQITATANMLGISRKGLWQKMKRLGIQREDALPG